MRISAITAVVWFVFVAAAAAEDAPAKTPLSEIRTIVHELEGDTDKLRELIVQCRSLVEQRPQQEGSSPEAKKAHEEQLAKWNSALERLLARIDGARADVVDSRQRLDKSITGELPTGLGKEVANARNQSDAERATAEQVLAKTKVTKSKSKPAKQEPASAKEGPDPALDDLDL